MDETLGAEKSERTPNRLGYRSGYYGRTLITRVGKLELRVPQDRQGRFRTEVFERYQRSEKALVGALAEMYVQGVSTRKVKEITEQLCGHEFSASTVSRINQTLDEELEQVRQPAAGGRVSVSDAGCALREGAGRRGDPQPGGAGGDRHQPGRAAVRVGGGVGQPGEHDQLAGVSGEAETAGLRGVEFVVTDDHAGLKQAIVEVLPEAAWQRCYVHFLRNALDYLPRKANDDCLVELRWLYDRHDLEQARQDLAAWLVKWQSKYPKMCAWVEANIEETFTFYRLPAEHHKHMKSTNMLERINEELKRRTLVVRIFPECGELPAAGAGAGGGDPRGLDRSDPLLEHGVAGGAQARAVAAPRSRRLTMNRSDLKRLCMSHPFCRT